MSTVPRSIVSRFSVVRGSAFGVYRSSISPARRSLCDPGPHHIMRISIIYLVLAALLLSYCDAWARRRRLPDANRKREVSTFTRRSVSDESPVTVQLQECTGEVDGCGFTIECECCSSPSFQGCGDTGLIGAPSLKLLKRRSTLLMDDLATGMF
eukprot:sb/3473268/